MAAFSIASRHTFAWVPVLNELAQPFDVLHGRPTVLVPPLEERGLADAVFV